MTTANQYQVRFKPADSPAVGDAGTMSDAQKNYLLSDFFNFVGGADLYHPDNFTTAWRVMNVTAAMGFAAGIQDWFGRKQVCSRPVIEAQRMIVDKCLSILMWGGYIRIWCHKAARFEALGEGSDAAA